MPPDQTPPDPFRDYAQIQQQMAAAMRAIQSQGGYDRILQQTNKAMEALQASAYDSILQQTNDAMRALQAAGGGYDRIVQQTNEAIRALQAGGGYDRILQQTSDAIRALQAGGGYDRILQQTNDAMRALQESGALNALTKDELEAADAAAGQPPPSGVSASASLRQALHNIDRLLLALFAVVGRLAVDAAGSRTLTLIADAIAVLVVLRTALAA